MTRRERIKARLIYRQWSIHRQLRWLPPYGWVTKLNALALGYSNGPLAIGVDLGKPGGDHSVIAFRRGDRITFHEIPAPSEAEIKALLERKSEAFRDIYEELAQAIFRGETVVNVGSRRHGKIAALGVGYKPRKPK